jgi:hypothetical protein
VTVLSGAGSASMRISGGTSGSAVTTLPGAGSASTWMVGGTSGSLDPLSSQSWTSGGRGVGVVVFATERVFVGVDDCGVVSVAGEVAGGLARPYHDVSAMPNAKIPTGMSLVLPVMSFVVRRAIDAAVTSNIAFVAIAFEVRDTRSVYAICFVVARAVADPVAIEESVAGAIG